jgi:uncharacterized membrane protein
MLGCAALERGQPLQVAHLFAGFRQHTNPLVIVGLLYLAASAAIVLLVVLVVGVPFMMTMMRGMQGPPWLSPMLLLGGLVALALYLPLVMATWFAPALVALHDMKPVDALKASFIGCLKNIVPFLIFGLVMLGLAVLATLPMLLGLLVYGPLLVASVYTGYRDIYTEPAP